jgi:hypothetical protein
MKAIWKYQIEITDEQSVMMPEGAEILTAQIQGRLPFVWAIVNPTAPEKKRTIEVIPTGMTFPDASRRYIGTVQTAEGRLVWHIFERI